MNNTELTNCVEDLRETLYKLQAITAALNDGLVDMAADPKKPNCYSLSLASMDYVKQAFHILDEIELSDSTTAAHVEPDGQAMANDGLATETDDE